MADNNGTPPGAGDPNNNSGNGSAAGNGDGTPPGAGDPGTPPNGEPQGGKQGGDDVPQWIKDELARARKEAAEERVKRRNLETAAEERERAQLAEQGQFKTLYEQATAQITALTAQIAAAENELAELRAIRDEQQRTAERERTDLLATLPDDIREAFATASVDQIRAVKRKLDAPGSSPGGQGTPPRGTAGTPPPENGKPSVPFAGASGISDVVSMLSKNKG
jgi:hypothetical protein